MSITLDIAVATWQPDGPQHFAATNPPHIPGVRYILSWQAHGNAAVPAELEQRDDVLIFRTDSKGLSANRNNALEHCTADIIINSDDDIVYSAQGIKELMCAFEKNPEVDLIMAQYTQNDRPAKNYPTEPCSITTRMPRGLYICSIELAIRRKGRLGALRFDTAYGLGGTMSACGEDEMYLLAAQRAKADCRFFPITIAAHNHLTTGQRRITDPRVLMGMGGVIRHSYNPITVLPRLMLKALRLQRAGQAPFLRSLPHLLKGAALLPPPLKLP